MSRRTGRLLTATLATGLVLSLGSAALAAAPIGALKQYKVPTANSQPRAITDGSDGNRWFTESDEQVNFAKIARITPAGAITEFTPDPADGCSSCGILDIAQGPGGILYITNNSRNLMRFNLATLDFESPVVVPSAIDTLGNLVANATDVWITDFNANNIWRYNISSETSTQFPVPVTPSDVAVDGAGDVWFTAPNDQSVNRLDPATGDVTRFEAPAGLAPFLVTVATDDQIWFTSRFGTQGVGRFNPTTEQFTTFLTPGTGPQGITAGPNGSIWFTQILKDNIARIDSSDTITEGKVVKGSDPFAVVVAPNGDPWYTMHAANKIATLQLR
jgi:virginiamycin B lyase